MQDRTIRDDDHWLFAQAYRSGPEFLHEGKCHRGLSHCHDCTHEFVTRKAFTALEGDTRQAVLKAQVTAGKRVPQVHVYEVRNTRLRGVHLCIIYTSVRCTSARCAPICKTQAHIGNVHLSARCMAIQKVYTCKVHRACELHAEKIYEACASFGFENAVFVQMKQTPGICNIYNSKLINKSSHGPSSTLGHSSGEAPTILNTFSRMILRRIFVVQVSHVVVDA